MGYRNDGSHHRTDTAGVSLTLSYFLICVATVFSGDISIAVRTIAIILLAGTFAVFCFVKKRSIAELLSSVPLAALSVICSWLFLL